jgi:hypothetical protein
MSRTIELPEDVYVRIEKAASASGNSVAEVIAARFPDVSRDPTLIWHGCTGPDEVLSSEQSSPTLAERLAGRLGTFASGGLEAIASRPGDAFSDYLIEKKRNGTL